MFYQRPVIAQTEVITGRGNAILSLCSPEDKDRFRFSRHRVIPFPCGLRGFYPKDRRVTISAGTEGEINRAFRLLVF